MLSFAFQFLGFRNSFCLLRSPLLAIGQTENCWPKNSKTEHVLFVAVLNLTEEFIACCMNVCVSGEGFLLDRRLILQECGSIVLHAQVDMAGAASSSTAGSCAYCRAISNHWDDDYS